MVLRKKCSIKSYQNFHDGECQVLVATSVLEQGIDVAACGVVICFDGVKSMKSIIQTRVELVKRLQVLLHLCLLIKNAK